METWFMSGLVSVLKLNLDYWWLVRHNQDYAICMLLFLCINILSSFYNILRSDCSMSENDVQAAGRVYAFKYPSNKPLMILVGEENFEQFGYDFDLSVQLDNRKVIAVSSITKSNNFVFYIYQIFSINFCL